MVTPPEEANKSYKEFKALQEEWKEIKNVPKPRKPMNCGVTTSTLCRTVLDGPAQAQ